jgi:hypothetical protein
MLREVLETKKAKMMFQVLFLRNDSSQEVVVHDDIKQVDFQTIQKHLEHGESVFITSKNKQKLTDPKQKEKLKRSVKTRIVTAFRFENTG